MTSVLISSLSLVAIPVYVKHSISFFETGPCGRLDITIGPKQSMGKTVESLMVRIHMPKTVSSANLTATQGNYTYDLATKVINWSKDDAHRGRGHTKSCTAVKPYRVVQQGESHVINLTGHITLTYVVAGFAFVFDCRET